MSRDTLLLSLAVLASTVIRSISLAAAPPAPDWIREYGSLGDDLSYAVSADGLGNAYQSGATVGNLGGTNAGDFDIFVRKFDTAGSTVWTRQLGTSTTDRSFGIAADKLGNVFFSGTTLGNLAGTNAGGSDVVLGKYNAAGTLQWTRQLGTAVTDLSNQIAADGLGNVYVSGYTSGNLSGTSAGQDDAILIKYDAVGNQVWIKQFGTAANDYARSVWADIAGNIYVAGNSNGNLGGPNTGDYDVTLTKFNSSGTQIWTRLFGTVATDYGNDVAVDYLGNVYVSGLSTGSLQGTNAGGFDAIVRKYDASGNHIWTKQFGTPSEDYAAGVGTDPFGNVYVSGHATGMLPGGPPGLGESDVFLTKLDSAGNVLWISQQGSSSSEEAWGFSNDELGNVFQGSYTSGVFGGGYNNGNINSYIIKYHEAVPEPSSLALLMIAMGIILQLRRTRQ
jgi:hypothetical protein